MTTVQPPHIDTEESVSIRWDEFRTLWDRAGASASRAGRGRTDIAASTLWVGALFVVFVTWNGAAGKTSVGEQIPYLVSGGLVTISLAVAGSIVFLLGVVSAARSAELPGAEAASNTEAAS